MDYLVAVPIVVLVLAGVFVLIVLRVSGIVRYIPNTRAGVVEKLWSAAGSVKQGLIALKGEAGFQPDTLRGGFHFFLPFQYRIHGVPLVTISQGKIGYVFARDGKPLAPSQTLASNDRSDTFEDVRAFLQNGGQKGPQRKLLREGTYALNLAQFVVVTSDGTLALNLDKTERALFEEMGKIISERNGFTPVVIKDELDRVGVITTHDGPSLPPGEIIAPTVGVDPANDAVFHNNFQDIEKFLRAGGFRGRQYQVLADGTYYINRNSSLRPWFRWVRWEWWSLTWASAERTSRARSTGTGSSWIWAIEASGSSRCCPESTPSTPTRGRPCSYRPLTSSSSGARRSRVSTSSTRTSPRSR